MSKNPLTDSPNLSARQRARAAIQKERDRQKKVENILVDIFTALDAQHQATITIGEKLTQLEKLGESPKNISAMTNLPPREITTIINTYKATLPTQQPTSHEPSNPTTQT